ncbi:putative harbinger transposase-derived protein [Forsythia ovata]|uniref:Harbinger transposase-derived protein n=1 Tax=Forsythia ovata TaxID=205694 RepID=A0ABD1U6Y2_9LAMI
MNEDPFNKMITYMVIEDEDEEDDLEFQMVMGQLGSMVGNTNQGSSSTPQYKDCGQEAGYRQLMKDYFCPCPIYNQEEFRTRFRMNRSLFERILHDVVHVELYFCQERDAYGCEGFSPYHGNFFPLGLFHRLSSNWFFVLH